jgi:PBSX family phage terminase large subunit
LKLLSVEKKKPKLRLVLGPKATAPKFRPYLRSTARHLLLWGGRDSTKSDFVALKLLLDCLQLPYFLCVLIREKQNTIADSQIATLKKVARREGLEHYFRFPQGPTGVLEVNCRINNNKFIGRGTDDMDRVKSVSDPTCAWYEEANQIEKADADVLGTSLRTSLPGTLIQEIYSFNPDHEGDYKSFWVYEKFFKNTGHPNDLTFSGDLVVDIDGKLVKQSFEVLHSTIQDNPWGTLDRKATFKGYQHTDPYRYRVWWEGLWATKQTGNEWYYQFKKDNHVRKVEYLQGLTIFQSWDANADPYSAMICAQLEQLAPNKHRLRIFKEYAIRGAAGGLRSTARQYVLDHKDKYPTSSVAYTGDASMKNRKPGSPQESAFKDVQAEMMPVASGASDIWLKHNPSVLGRRDWINSIWAGEDPTVEVWIDEGCTELIQDIELTQKGIGEKLKELYHDTEKGVTYQIRGHFTDCFEYLMASRFPDKLEVFLKRGAKR